MTWEEGTLVECALYGAALVPMLVILGVRWVLSVRRRRRETDDQF